MYRNKNVEKNKQEDGGRKKLERLNLKHFEPGKYKERLEKNRNPSRMDHVYTGKVSGECTNAQKRYLLRILRDISIYPETIFKKQFVYQRENPETSCLCEICENAALMGKAARRYKRDHPTDTNNIEERYCCNSMIFSYINSTCGE